MKKLCLLAISLIFVSCGNDVINPTIQTEFIKQEWENVYFFENNSQLEIVTGIDNELTILRENQYLTSVNPENGTLAMHPTISLSGIEPIGNKFTITRNVNYNDGNDLEEDETGRDIRGTKRTDFTFTLKDLGKIDLKIEIYCNKLYNNTNFIIATREFKSI